MNGEEEKDQPTIATPKRPKKRSTKMDMVATVAWGQLISQFAQVCLFSLINLCIAFDELGFFQILPLHERCGV